jgi:hypothetical protein
MKAGFKDENLIKEFVDERNVLDLVKGNDDDDPLDLWANAEIVSGGQVVMQNNGNDGGDEAKDEGEDSDNDDDTSECFADLIDDDSSAVDEDKEAFQTFVNDLRFTSAKLHNINTEVEYFTDKFVADKRGLCFMMKKGYNLCMFFNKLAKMIISQTYNAMMIEGQDSNLEKVTTKDIHKRLHLSFESVDEVLKYRQINRGPRSLEVTANRSLYNRIYKAQFQLMSNVAERMCEKIALNVTNNNLSSLPMDISNFKALFSEENMVLYYAFNLISIGLRSNGRSTQTTPLAITNNSWDWNYVKKDLTILQLKCISMPNCDYLGGKANVAYIGQDGKGSFGMKRPKRVSAKTNVTYDVVKKNSDDNLAPRASVKQINLTSPLEPNLKLIEDSSATIASAYEIIDLTEEEVEAEVKEVLKKMLEAKIDPTSARQASLIFKDQLKSKKKRRFDQYDDESRDLQLIETEQKKKRSKVGVEEYLLVDDVMELSKDDQMEVIALVKKKKEEAKQKQEEVH